jgi:sulfatase modifying factor 1
MKKNILLISLAVFVALVGCDRIKPEMVKVPAGWFWMGNDQGRPSARPAHHIYLDAYAIDRTEVTRADFAKYVQSLKDSSAKWEVTDLLSSPNEPVTGVLWTDAAAYCRWAGKRLPTEAEWEKAARGTETFLYPWGDVWDPTLCNSAESGHGKVLPVGRYPRGASPYGALDMAGNAAEWVADYFDSLYYEISPSVNPSGPSQILDHGLRGGSFASSPEQTSTFFRDSSHSVKPNPRTGFRCAKSLTE